MRVLRLWWCWWCWSALAVGFFVFVPFGPSAETFVDIPPGTGTVGIARAAGEGRDRAERSWAFEGW